MTRRICKAVDLDDDPRTFALYDRLHGPDGPPPEVQRALREAGLLEVEIYRVSNRLFMILELADEAKEDASLVGTVDPVVHAWDEAMTRLQRPIVGSGESGWATTALVYRLSDRP